MFNENSKKKNILLSSSFGVFEQILFYLTSFVFRTIFLKVLSEEYLGITGLFTNILQIFSLAELGIGSVISFRMYSPVRARDEKKCRQLLDFYKNVYFLIAFVVFIIGLLFLPFLPHIFADSREIPHDVNLTVIYWLFVFQNVASYCFVYMQSLLSADEKNYVLSFSNCIYNALCTILKIILLIVTKKYMLVLVSGIVLNFIYNVILALYIRVKYKSIFNTKVEKISKIEKKQILKDTGALMCHKIGYVIVNSTDSLILSKFIGIGIIGLYSNYQLIASAIDTMMNKLLGSFIPTIGNISIDASSEKKYSIYSKLLFLNMWIASFCSVCYFVLIEPFIKIWLGDSFLLSKNVALIISLNIFFNSSRIINSVFTSATGLFVKDKIRPLVQGLLNLLISIFLVKKMGISGVFLGTLLSLLLTVWWREGIILYRDLFNKSVWTYYAYYLFWVILTCITAVLFSFICKFIPINFSGLILKFLLCGIGINVFFSLIFFKNEKFSFYINFIKTKLKKEERL